MADDEKHCPRLTVAMVVRDAEDCLAASLDSVRNLADEIVVLDTGSRDSTIRIARQRATAVISHKWTDDVAAARNAALAAATGDWVLWLEAGETLPAATIENLRRFIDSEAEETKAYYLLVHTPAEGANIAGEQVARIRLHPQVKGLQFAGRVRESLVASLEELALSTDALPWSIERTPRAQDAALRRQLAQRNLHLARLAIDEEGENARLLNCLGEAAQTLGENAASIAWYREALAHSAAGSAEMLEAYYGVLTALEGSDSTRVAQLQLCMQALEVFPLDAQLLCAVGGYLQARNQHDLALRAYHVAAMHGQITLEIAHLEGLPEIAVNCYAATLQLLGRDDEAQKVLDEQLAANPAWLRLRRQLLELHVRHGRRDEALAAVDGMPRSVPNREALRSAVRGACLTATGNWISGRSYLETAYKAGCREPLCLRWLAAVYLAADRHDDAQRMLDEWSRVDPLSPELRQYRQALAPASRPASDRQLRVDESAASPAVPAPTLPMSTSRALT